MGSFLKNQEKLTRKIGMIWWDLPPILFNIIKPTDLLNIKSEVKAKSN